MSRAKEVCSYIDDQKDKIRAYTLAGMTNAEIASILKINPRQLESYRQRYKLRKSDIIDAAEGKSFKKLEFNKKPESRNNRYADEPDMINHEADLAYKKEGIYYCSVCGKNCHVTYAKDHVYKRISSINVRSVLFFCSEKHTLYYERHKADVEKAIIESHRRMKERKNG